MARPIAAVVTAALLTCAAPLLAGDWTTWRGPNGDGNSAETGLPVKWDAQTNITWKVPLPDGGNSSPIVLGDRVFITCATDRGAKRWTLCFNRADGKPLWQDAIEFSGNEPTHDGNPYCSATPVTDGQRLYVMHGSAGVIAYDLDGKRLWTRDLGPLTHIWGNASSPVLHGEHVIVYAGPGLACSLTALNKSDGSVAWSTPLPEAQAKEAKDYFGSWSTPTLRRAGDVTEIVLSLPRRVVAFDPATGKRKWSCDGLTDLAYTNALVGDKAIVAMSGYMGAAIGLKAPAPDASGDLTATHQLWRTEKNKQRVGSGVLVGEHVYILNEDGVAQCLEAVTGKQIWLERVGGSSWGSMNHADGKLYVTDMQGTTHVLKASTTFEHIASNPLKEMTRATPAFSDGQIFIRTYQHLYCIGERKH